MLRMCCSSSRAMVSNSPRMLRGKSYQPRVRYSSSGGGGVSGGKILGTTLAVSAATIGGVVGYSAADQNFRITLEESIPGSSQIMELVLGEKEPISPPVSSKKISSSVMVTQPKVEDQHDTATIPSWRYSSHSGLEITDTPIEKQEAPELPSALEVSPYVEEHITPSSEESRISAAESARVVTEESAVALRIAEEEAAVAEASRIATEEAAGAEAAKAAEEEAAVAEASRIAAAEAEKVAAAEASRIVTEEVSAVEAAMVATEEAAGAEAAKAAEEEAAVAEASRIAAAEAAAAEAEKVAAAEASRIAAEEVAAAEAARVATEEAAVAEASRIATEEAAAAEAANIAAVEAVVAEASRIAAEEAAAVEAAKVAAAEASRIATEEVAIEEAAVAEASRIATEEAAAAEAANSAAEEDAVAGASSIAAKEAAASEAARVATEDAAAAEVVKIAAEEAEAARVVAAEVSAAEPPATEFVAPASELLTVLKDPEPPVEGTKALASEMIEVPEDMEAQIGKPESVVEVTAPLLDETEGLASATELPPVLAVSVPLFETPEAPVLEQPTVLEDPAPPKEKPEDVDVPVAHIEIFKDPTSAPNLPTVMENSASPTKAPASESELTAEDVTETIQDLNKEIELISPTTAEDKEPECVPDIENSNLEMVLLELCKEMQEMVASAVSEYDAFSDAVITHVNMMQKVLDLNLTVKDDAAWNEMFLAAQSKLDKAKSVELIEKEAMVTITNVMENISAGIENTATSTNPNLVLAEENANLAIYQMDLAKARLAAVESEAVVMEKYRDLVEAGREQFHKEMASIMPDVKLGEKSGKLSEYELNMFITHAYNKVMFLEQEVAKQQTLEQAKFIKALEMQKIETETLAMEHTGEELERQARELIVEHEKKMVKIKEEAEEQQRSHLKRQAAAHTDHVTDMLTIQETELTRHHDHQLAEQVDSLTKTQTDSLASLSGSVSGLTAALQARAASDSASLSAQSLWLACNSLSHALSTGRSEATNWEDKLQPLVHEVDQVKLAAGGEDKFVDVVLASISPIAMQRGVFTEDSLKERFCVVEKTARRVAGIGEEGGSLLAFGLSFVQSLLVVDLVNRAPVETLEEVDLANVSPIDLVTLARHNLDRGNLGQAVQLMTQLKGEPGRVATDWLTEARLTLETRQAVEAMLVYSQANSCKYMPGV